MNKEVIKEVITDLELLISHLKELSKDDEKEKKSNKENGRKDNAWRCKRMSCKTKSTRKNFRC